jgi:hypothetical protein
LRNGAGEKGILLFQRHIFRISATWVKIIFKNHQSWMDVTKQYAVGSAEQKKANMKN